MVHEKPCLQIACRPQPQSISWSALDSDGHTTTGATKSRNLLSTSTKSSESLSIPHKTLPNFLNSTKLNQLSLLLTKP